MSLDVDNACPLFLPWRLNIKRLEFTLHARRMLKERRIAEEWVMQTLSHPARTEQREDGTVHHLKAIPEHGGRMLRVVTNPKSDPPQIVTVFFDRRAKGEL